MFNNSQPFETFSIIEALYPEQLLIALSSEEIEQAKPREQDYSNNWARKNAWINRITVNAICRCLQEITGEEVSICEEETLHTIWEVVNGTAINLSGKRIILIPREDLDTEEFIVPAEWIKIHDWIGDYYLAVQVNLEHMWLRVWGCTTHKQIMDGNKYDSVWRNYCLDSEELFSDINAMLIARNYDAVNMLAVDSLDSLTSSQVDSLMKDLTQPCSFSPRYKVDIEQWCVLIANSNYRKELYSQRCSNILTPESARKTVTTQVTNLGNWFKHRYELGWESIRELIHPSLANAFVMPIETEKAKLITLGKEKLVLKIQLQKDTKENEITTIITEVSPSKYSDSHFLPKNLKLLILDSSGKIFKEVTSTDKDYRIFYKFTAEEGEKFKINLVLAQFTEEEYFIIQS